MVNKTQALAQQLHTGYAIQGEHLLWAVYKKPRDYPSEYVARPFFVEGAKPIGFIVTANSLEEVRKLLPAGLCMIERSDIDDPVIVETWI